MPAPITGFFEQLGLPEILLWLLTFAVVYGVLSQLKIPQSNATRAIIGMIAGFLVLFAVPGQLITVLSKMASSLLLVVLGLLVIIIFLEVAQVKVHKEEPYQTKEGERGIRKTPISIFEKYGKIIAIILIIIAILIFIYSGGLQLLGIQQITFGGISGNALLFLIIIIAVIAWMIYESKEK